MFNMTGLGDLCFKVLTEIYNLDTFDVSSFMHIAQLFKQQNEDYAVKMNVVAYQHPFLLSRKYKVRIKIN